MLSDKYVKCVMVWLDDSQYSFLKRVSDEMEVSPGYFLRLVVELVMNKDHAIDEK